MYSSLNKKAVEQMGKNEKLKSGQKSPESLSSAGSTRDDPTDAATSYTGCDSAPSSPLKVYEFMAPPRSQSKGVQFKEPVRDGTIIDGEIQLSTPLDDMSLTMPPRQDAPEVDVQDADTPDKWIKRHTDMVRLTGRHPFNSEPKLPSLQAAGWITPPSLHVVRNHGAVPQLDFNTHTLKISGVPFGDCELSMEQLISGQFGPQVSFPVSFICAGNRRKEQNMTKKDNWLQLGMRSRGQQCVDRYQAL